MRAGDGAIVFDVVAARTAITSARSRAPLKLLTPRNHGGARWAFLSTYGGGLVDGDAIDLDVKVRRGAKALLGTQASTKVYRCPRGEARQALSAEVEGDALLVVAPDPLTPFAGARYDQRATLRLASSASLAWVDVLACGRAARAERWAFARYASRARVLVDSALVCDDALVLDAADRDLVHVFGRFDAVATLFVIGPALATTREALLARALPAPRAEVVFSASPLGDRGACVRVAGTTLAGVTDLVRDALSDLRATLGDDPYARKW